MNENSKFCSIHSQISKEPIAGTARQAERFIFLGWPKPDWHFNQAKSRGMASELTEFLMRVRRNDEFKIRLFDQRDLNDGHVIIVCPQMLKVQSVPTTGIKECLQTIMEYQTAPYKSQTLSGRHLFICTHGTRDMCCAKFGFGAVKGLKAELTRNNKFQSEWSIWETTHLIGDRFAGTGIVFPEGQMYGHLNEEMASNFIQVIDTGQVYERFYRGNVFLSEKHQVVEAVLQKYLSSRKLEGQISVRDADRENVVNFDVKKGNTRISGNAVLSFKEVEYFSNCQQLTENRKSHKNIWVIDDLEFMD